MKALIIDIMIVVIVFVLVATDPDLKLRELLMFWLMIVLIALLFGIYFSI